MEYEIIGTRESSGFRVPADYFERKHRFAPTCVPHEGGPLAVVEAGTDKVVVGAVIQGGDSGSRERGRVVIPT